MTRVTFIHALSANRRLLVAAFVAALIFAFPLGPWLEIELRLIAAWIAGALSYLALSFYAMYKVTNAELRRRAQELDGRGLLVVVLVVVAAMASMAALVFLMQQKEEQQGAELAWRLALGGVSMVCAWTMIHVVYAMHYAHLFYDDEEDTPELHDYRGGLEFPGDEEPGYSDFLYYSFVIGMTCQVSDVQAKSRRLRRITLIHSVLSFFFNTAILAMSINMAASML